MNRPVLIFLLLVWQLSSPAQSGVFLLGTHVFSDTCAGTLYDSGGPAGNYSNSETLSFTLCPQQPTQCLLLDVQSFDLENNFDFLYLIAGTSLNGPKVATLNGGGGNLLIQVHAPCVTVLFTSDNSTTGAGFSLSWQCSPNSCNVPMPSTCGLPTGIASLPWSAANLSTCYAWDEIQPGTCPGDAFLASEDFIFSYQSPGNECIALQLVGSLPGTGIAVFDQCPEEATSCLALSPMGSTQPRIEAVFLENPGMYYFVVDNLSQCTPFDILVEKTACPVVFPSPALCSDALSFNGCSPAELPAVITVAPGLGQAGFLQPGVNLGCWANMFPLNFAWFFFEAKADGEFAFVLDAAHPDEASDVDFQVWGPITDVTQACQFAATQPPIRSSYADGVGPTGLAQVHPLTGAPVTDLCEDVTGDDFLHPIPVQAGEFYLVLINDWEGNIVSGAVAIDFAGTSPGVLDQQLTFTAFGDTTLCPGSTTQLLATGGEAYQWIPAQGLSCTFCPNPVATVPEAGTYSVAIHTVCHSDTLPVSLEVFRALAGNDRTACLGEEIQLMATSDLPGQVAFQWQASSGFLSCQQCDNTFFSSSMPGMVEVILTATNQDCLVSDTLSVTILDSPVPVYSIAENDTICLGDSLFIGGMEIPGVSYSWYSEPPGMMASVANPSVGPSTATTYFLKVKQEGCPVEVSDSVVIAVVEPPAPHLGDQFICPGDTARLDPMLDSSFHYSWTSANPAFTDSSAVLEVAPDITTVFFLSIDNGVCQPVSDTAVVFIAEKGILEISPDTLLCGGSPVGLFANAGVPGMYFWNEGSPDAWVNSDAAKPYVFQPDGETHVVTVKFIDAAACDTLFDTVLVVVKKPPAIDRIVANHPDTVYLGTSITLQVLLKETLTASYHWSNADTGSVTTVLATTSPVESWQVTVTDAWGCTDTSSVVFTVLEPLYDVPNAFSPNGDGVNDRFSVVYRLEQGFRVLYLKVYNRWGTLVYEERNGNTGWDGNYKGKPVPADVYIYRIALRLPGNVVRELVGEVSLLR